jgi:hypothetical protein
MTEGNILIFYRSIFFIAYITILPYDLVIIYKHIFERFRKVVNLFTHMWELLGSNLS